MTLLHVAASAKMNDDEKVTRIEEVVQYILDHKLIDVNECSKVGVWAIYCVKRLWYHDIMKVNCDDE